VARRSGAAETGEAVNADGVEWNPITGCSPASTGCANCIPMKLAGLQRGEAPSYRGLTQPRNSGPVWNGQVRLNLPVLSEPFALPGPEIIAVCSHGDLFHENVPRAWVDQVFDIMQAAPWHSFMVGTKRARRMRRYVDQRRLAKAIPQNIFFGVAVERQRELDERAPDLIALPVARYLSLYPLLGPVRLGPYLQAGMLRFVAAGMEVERPAEPAWFVSIEAQCKAAGVPYVRSDRLMGVAAA
jgi:protein gp37